MSPQKWGTVYLEAVNTCTVLTVKYKMSVFMQASIINVLFMVTNLNSVMYSNESYHRHPILDSYRFLYPGVRTKTFI